MSTDARHDYRCTTPVALLLLVAMGMLFGCGDGRPAPRKVIGTVTYHGKPIEDATVTFLPSGGRPAMGTTDAEGRFTLLTFKPGDGAIEGEHVVCVAKAMPDPNGDKSSPYTKYISLLPERYASSSKSPLRATVTKNGPNEFQYDLTD